MKAPEKYSFKPLAEILKDMDCVLKRDVEQTAHFSIYT